jgi:threonine aldolase
MAARLRSALEAGIADGSLPGLAFTQASQSNAIFATLPTDVADRIRERVRFYDWDRARGEVRWMMAWDTTESDIDGFVAVIREEFERGAS